MLVFPLTEEGATGCRFQKLEDGSSFLLFRQDGRLRRDLTVVTEPEREQYALLDSFVSGGTFREYLEESMAKFQGRICLYLYPQAYRFSLPCPDGRGEAIDLQAGAGLRYSEALCCLWRVTCCPEVCMELSDCERSLREKYRLAEMHSVPLLIAKPKTLDIVKAPCKQGA